MSTDCPGIAATGAVAAASVPVGAIGTNAEGSTSGFARSAAALRHPRQSQARPALLVGYAVAAVPEAASTLRE